MAEGAGNRAPLVIERPHDACHAGRHALNVKGEIAARRLDPGGAKYRAGRMQDHVHIGEVARKNVRCDACAAKQRLRGIRGILAIGQGREPDALGLAGDGDVSGRVLARDIGQRRQFGDRRRRGTKGAKGVTELQRAAGMTRIEHDRHS